MSMDSSARERFDVIYCESLDRVYSYARARVGPMEAEDVASEVFAAALKALESGRGEAVTEAWLMAVARNKVIDRWRAAQRRAAKLHLLRPVPTQPRDDHRTDRVTLALDRLTLQHRAVLVLHYLDGHPMKEVAEQLGLSVEAARSSLARARRALRVAYGGVDVDG